MDHDAAKISLTKNLELSAISFGDRARKSKKKESMTKHSKIDKVS